MTKSYGWSKPYVASFAINKSCLRQPNTFDKSVSSIPPTTLLPKLFSSFFYNKKKVVLSAVTFSESTLMFRENLIRVTTHLIKDTPFIIFK